MSQFCTRGSPGITDFISEEHGGKIRCLEGLHFGSTRADLTALGSSRINKQLLFQKGGSVSGFPRRAPPPCLLRPMKSVATFPAPPLPPCPLFFSFRFPLPFFPPRFQTNGLFCSALSLLLSLSGRRLLLLSGTLAVGRQTTAPASVSAAAAAAAAAAAGTTAGLVEQGSRAQ